MALFRLMASLGMDTSHYNAGMDQAEQRANVFANRFRRSLTSTLTKGVTIGFAISMIRSVMADAEKLNAVSDATRETITSAKQGWALFADAGKSAIATIIAGLINLNRWVDKIFFGGKGTSNIMTVLFGTGGGTPIEDQEEVVKRIERMQAKLDAAVTKRDQARKKAQADLLEKMDENALKALKGDESALRAALEARMKVVSDLMATRLTETQRLGLGFEMERLRGLLMDVKPDQEQFKNRFINVLSGGPVDPLARIGGIGKASDVLVVSYQERTARATERTAENTRPRPLNFQ